MTLPVRPPVAPMLAKLARELPRDAGLFYEPKWDGFRCIVFRDGDEVELGSRNEKPLTRYFPELVDALRRELPDRGACSTARSSSPAPAAWSSTRCPSASTRPRSASASSPSRRRPRSSPSTCWPRATARSWRRRTRSAAPRWRRPCKKARPPVHLTPVTDDPDVAADWFSRFEGAGLDGVVVKDGALTYLPDKRAMVKVKHQRTADCVVAGFRTHKDGAGVGSLLLGPLRPRRDAAPRRRGLGVQRGPPARAGRRARAVPEGRAEGPPVGGLGRGAGRRPGARWDEPLERRQGHDLGAAAARGGVRGLLRPPAAGPLPARHVLRALASRTATRRRAPTRSSTPRCRWS